MNANFLALSAGLALAFSSTALAQGAPETTPIATPQDVAFGGVISLEVDATDVARGIFRVRERVPLSGAGPVTLLFPEWLPGTHAPRGPIDKLAGLTIEADGKALSWTRDPVNIYAFHVAAPEGARALDISFQHLSPVTTAQGRVVATDEMLNLQWHSVLLYPAGYYAKRLMFDASVTLPEGWTQASALDVDSTRGARVDFAPTDLDTLVDSPLFAGRYYRRVALADDTQPVRLNIFADRADELAAADAHITPHVSLVTQARRLFGAQHYDHYDFLFAITSRMSGIGLEHHRSSENAVGMGYFSEWDKNFGARGLLPHELVHSWNGKHRRPADLWTPGFETPMRDTLLWVYEGQTQYWGDVLTARSGLWTKQQALEDLAITAAAYQSRVGRNWRALADTTHDPIILARRPRPWRSWQRREDYYSEGLLIWLDVDTLIRERTRGRKSLDDFARDFFGGENGDWSARTYTLQDVVAALDRVTPNDWDSFLRERVTEVAPRAPLDGLARGGYRLVFRDTRSDFQTGQETANKSADFTYSLGFSLGSDGEVTDVLWDGPAFNLGLTVGTKLVAVDGAAFDTDALRRAITDATTRQEPIEILVKDGDRYRTLAFDYHEGLKYPHLERIEGAPDLLGAIFAPRR